MEDFPPLPASTQSTTNSMATLCEMFPTMQMSVVEMVLEEAQGNCEKAMELLLDMSDEQPSPKLQTDPVITSLSQVSATFLSSISSSVASSRSTTPTSGYSAAAATCPAPPSSSKTRQTLSHTRQTTSPQQTPPGPLADLQKGHHVLVLLRGLPGSGKSTLARKLISSAKIGIILSTDDFFMQGGVYTFQPSLLSDAHAFNQKRAMSAVRDREKLIIIDNTNTAAWEMRPYIELAMNNSYKVHLLEPDTSWKFKPKLLAAKNSHNVPRQKIEVMLDRYEKNITLERLKSMWNISEPKFLAINSQDEEIFESDDEEGNESLIPSNINPSDQYCTSVLNPGVEEFVPVQYQGMVDEESYMVDMEEFDADSSISADGSEHSGDLLLERRSSISISCGGSPDIERLLAMFPHLSMDQVKTLYDQHGQQTTEVISTLLDNAAPGPPDILNHDSPDEEDKTVSMALDPLFAVTLQECFGPPLDDSMLQFLNTGELLSMEIPSSLARQIFCLWQKSLQSVLHSKPVLETVAQTPADNMYDWHGAAGGRTAGATAGQIAAAPQTVLAPNAVDYYEKKMLDEAVKASLSTNNNNKVKPLIVVKPSKHQHKNEEEEGEAGLDQFIEQRDRLYRQAMETRGSNMQGAASYYAAQARELNSHIKASQKQSQMDLFLQANKDNQNTKLDLHYLHTADAIKQLQQFISHREAMARNSSSGAQSVEVVTGKGTRSENGKSRLRPAVQNWLEQKNYSYTEVNCGCFRVVLKSDK